LKDASLVIRTGFTNIASSASGTKLLSAAQG
jgi:hypothetical protein